MLSEGRVMRGVGGLYEVRIPVEGGERRVSCRGRGILRRDDDKLMVGDLCLVREEGEEAVIEEILKKSTESGENGSKTERIEETHE